MNSIRVPCVLLAASSVFFGCSSTLKVASKPGAEGGVPFYLPEQEIRITQLGLMDDKTKADVEPLQISLVTRPDFSRQFFVQNSPAILAKSDFTVNRDSSGILTGISASSQQGLTDAAKSVITLAVAAAAAARPTQNELDALKAKKKSLVDQLKAESDPAKIKVITEALQNIEDLITKNTTQPAVGTLPTREFRVPSANVHVEEDEARVIDAAKTLKNDDDFHIYLVPTAK